MIPDFLQILITQLLGQPFLLGMVLAFATFISEDATLILGSQLLNAGEASAIAIFLALVFGILTGDIGLYGLGYLAREKKGIRRYIPLKAARSFKRWIKGRETSVLFLSRFLPGTRLPLYVSFGFLNLSLTRFSLVMAGAAFLWVGGILFFIQEIQSYLMSIDTRIGWLGGIAVAILLIIIMPQLFKKTRVMATYKADHIARMGSQYEDERQAP